MFPRWLRFLLPAPGPLSLLAGAGALLGLGLLAAVGYALSQTGLFLENFGFLYGLFCVPPAAVLLAAAALWEKHPLPRAGLWLGAALALAAGGLLAALAIATSPAAGLAAGLTTYALFCVPPAVGSALVGLYFAGRGAPAARAALHAERADRALHMLEARGEVTLAELAAELGAPAGECDQLVDGLLRGGQLAGFFDAPRGRVYTQTALRARQKQLVAVVQARGQVSFDDLAAELRAPRDLLRGWVYEAVRRGEFTGYLNWSEGLLYSADAAKLRASDRCPRCGGELALAGQGVIQCGHCGVEVFLT
jgi:ribosomal protein S27AE